MFSEGKWVHSYKTDSETLKTMFLKCPQLFKNKDGNHRILGLTHWRMILCNVLCNKTLMLLKLSQKTWEIWKGSWKQKFQERRMSLASCSISHSFFFFLTSEMYTRFLLSWLALMSSFPFSSTVRLPKAHQSGHFSLQFALGFSISCLELLLKQCKRRFLFQFKSIFHYFFIKAWLLKFWHSW